LRLAVNASSGDWKSAWMFEGIAVQVVGDESVKVTKQKVSDAVGKGKGYDDDVVVGEPVGVQPQDDIDDLKKPSKTKKKRKGNGNGKKGECKLF